MAADELSRRFHPGSPPALLTGVQAIARLLLEQRALDRRRGRRTATFVSGYQGSPLGGLDRLLQSMPELMRDNAIHVRPALNEEIAATSVWGSQTTLPLGTATHDGVVGVWYGKAPGVDRATDALRHLTMYGVNPAGGVLLLAGDDPAAKSSTVPAVSERTLAALGIPVLFPRTSAEIITLGLHGVELSRACGSPVALKIVADVADGAWVVTDEVSGLDPVTPTITWQGSPWTYRQSPPLVGSAAIVSVESELVGPRAAMIQTYAVANRLDHRTSPSGAARLGLVASGPAFDSMRQALLDLGADEDLLAGAGVRLMHCGLLSPVSVAGIRDFAEGLDAVLVVEDKTSFLESQVRSILYDLPERPKVLGKHDTDGAPLVPADGELTPGRLHEPLRRALAPWLTLEVPRPRRELLTVRESLPLKDVRRVPYFCSGCPHNRSTAVPVGSMAAGGIGCHTLVTTSRRTDSAVTGFTQMGGEGAQWIGQAPFTSTRHIFQNIGDGTFFHSGQLSVQACVAAGVNVTFKLLHNDVVAMTGAQQAEGAIDIPALTHKLAAEGVARTIVVTDEPDRHHGSQLADDVVVWDRSRLDEAQRLLRETPGVTVLIYAQHCANDARRQRKRGTMPARRTRVVIHEEVCEGCGDCGRKSNCLSVQPVMTELGLKTRVDQTSCNTDYSCLEGDCPAFMTVTLPEDTGVRTPPVPPAVPPTAWRTGGGTQSVLLAGVGGTGIVTVNQVLATAALAAGYAVELLDQIGLSQKAGPVIGHLRFSADGPLEPSNRLSPGAAHALLAFDLLTAVEPAMLAYTAPDLTRAVVSTSTTPTGTEVYDRELRQAEVPAQLGRLRGQVRELATLDMLADARVLLGSTTAANFFLVGAAVQIGALQIPPDAIEAALGLNGEAVAANVAAFRWGRVSVADPAAYAAAVSAAGRIGPATDAVPQHVPALTASALAGEVRRLVEWRAPRLVDYQNLACAEDYVRIVDAVWHAERRMTNETRLSEAVARQLYALTAYKDEYEVARLLTGPSSRALVEAAVPGAGDITFRLHPPLLRALGLERKVGISGMGQSALQALVPLRRLRGTPLDPFGRARMRRVERELLRHYRSVLHSLVDSLTADSYARAADFAALPSVVRGFEDIKLRSVESYREQLRALGLPDLDLP